MKELRLNQIPFLPETPCICFILYRCMHYYARNREEIRCVFLDQHWTQQKVRNYFLFVDAVEVHPTLPQQKVFIFKVRIV